MDCMAERLVEHQYENVQKRNNKTLKLVCKVDDEILLNVGSENCDDEFTHTFQNLTCKRTCINNAPKFELHSNGGPLDNYKTSFWHCIYTTQCWKHKSYDPVWDYGQVQLNNGSNEDDLTANDVLELIACEDLPDINVNLVNQKLY